jgi:DNA-binding transcriptional MerR regulator
VLTIGQLAAYAGVTTRAVRHYHQIGLLPEPERDAAGYRSYTGPDVVRLIRIRTLAEAGVPLARVQELLAADEEGFARAVADIDQRLRAEIRQLQEHRRRIARLAAGDSLALPESVTAYLDRMRAMGVHELMVRLLQLLGDLISGEDDSEARLAETADLVVEMAEQAAARGELDRQDDALPDGSFADLLDTLVLTAGPRMVRLRDRLLELMAERGWSGLVKMERVERRADAGS